jgi:Rrf2 family transcriptional regulator, cysteine metabolism repressor
LTLAGELLYSFPTVLVGISRRVPRPALPPLRSTKLATRTYHSTGALSFSTKGEYGVRLMAQLALRFGTGPASLTEIAEQEDLPRAYLEQLVIGLRDADLVHSTRGAHGGYELTRPPEQIVMGDVLLALEGPIAPMICVTDDPSHISCARTGYCTVNLMWVRVRDAIAGALDSMTLADLVPSVARSSGLPVLTPKASHAARNSNPLTLD